MPDPLEHSPGGAVLPWYWTDELARALVSEGLLTTEVASIIAAAPVAVRRDEPSVEAAARAMLEDDEIPLAA